MAGHERRLDASGGPLVPVIYMEVGAADAGDLHLHQNVTRAVARNGDFANLRARFGLRLDYRHHGLLHRSEEKGDFSRSESLFTTEARSHGAIRSRVKTG